MIRFFPFLLFPFGFAVIARYQKKFCIQNFFFLMTSSMLRTKWLNFFVGSAAIVPHLVLENFYKTWKWSFKWAGMISGIFLKRRREGELHLFLITLYRQSDRRQVHLIGLNCTHRIAASGPGTLKENPYRTRTKTLHCWCGLIWPQLTRVRYLTDQINIGKP